MPESARSTSLIGRRVIELDSSARVMFKICLPKTYLYVTLPPPYQSLKQLFLREERNRIWYAFINTPFKIYFRPMGASSILYHKTVTPVCLYELEIH